MAKQRPTIEEARGVILKRLDINQLGTFGLRKLLEVIPFSWHCYCKDNNLNPNLLMDKHEKRVNRDNRKRNDVSKQEGDEKANPWVDDSINGEEIRH